MSGFEIAGVVLGAFPIAMSALQGYKQAFELLNFWKEIRREHRQCTDELRFNHTRYTYNLKQLLLPLVVDDDRISDLMAAPLGEAWKAPDAADALKSRLQGSYDLYFDTISEMQHVMEDLNNELAIDLSGLDGDAGRTSLQVDLSSGPTGMAGASSLSLESLPLPPSQKSIGWHIRGAFKHSFKSNKKRGAEYLCRAKFIFGQDRRKRLFADLQACNDRIDKLLRMSDDLSSLQVARQGAAKGAAKSVNAVCDFWNQACRLHKTLFESWSCTCRDRHCARLILQHRISSETEFQLLLSYGPAEPRLWQHCCLNFKGKAHEIAQVIEQEKTTLPPPCTPPGLTSTPQHRTTTPRKSALRSNNPKLMPPNRGESIPRLTVTLAPPMMCPSNTGPGDPDGHGRIPSLCSRFASITATTSDCVGFLEEPETRCYIYPQAQALTAADSYISLAEILTLAHDKPSRFSRRLRYQLALVIVSSFVQLKCTPWITASLGKTSIHFSHDASEGDAESAFQQLGPPLVARDFASSPVSSEADAAPCRAADTAAINALGVVLLELCFRKPIEKYPFREQLGVAVGDAAALDRFASLKWKDEVNDEAGPDYSDAVKWCLLGCEMLGPGVPWRREMVKMVVAPLERWSSYLNSSQTV